MDQALVELNQKVDTLTTQVEFLPRKRAPSSDVGKSGMS